MCQLCTFLILDLFISQEHFNGLWLLSSSLVNKLCLTVHTIWSDRTIPHLIFDLAKNFNYIVVNTCSKIVSFLSTDSKAVLKISDLIA